MRINNNYMDNNYFAQESIRTRKSDVNNNNFELPATEDEAIDFSQAVRDYKSEYLTGMTEEEWDEFYAKCKEYLDKNPINNEADAATFTSFMKSLLQDYGFKGDINEVCGIFGIDSSTTASSEQIDASTEMKPAKSQIITEPDGSRYLVITTSSGQTMKIKLAPENNVIYQENDLINLESESIYNDNKAVSQENDSYKQDELKGLAKQTEVSKHTDKTNDKPIDKQETNSLSSTGQAIKAYENNFILIE